MDRRPDQSIGGGNLPVTIPLQLGLAAGVSIGADAGSPVMTDYEPPFRFTGTVKKALVDVSGEVIEGSSSEDEDVSRAAIETMNSAMLM